MVGVSSRRIDLAIEVEGQVVLASRPIVAEVTDTAETAIDVVARTRSRIPYGLVGTELAGEVHTCVVKAVGVVKR